MSWQLHFCGDCGAQVTEDELRRGRASDAGQTVRCRGCSRKAGIVRPPTRMLMLRHLLKKERPTAGAGTAAPSRASTPTYVKITAAGIVVLLIAAGVALYRPDLLRGTSATPIQTASATAPSKPKQKAAARPNEVEAETAFDVLRQSLKPIPPDEPGRRVALIEGYLKVHGEAIVAARARALLDPARKEWNERATDAAALIARLREKNPEFDGLAETDRVDGDIVVFQAERKRIIDLTPMRGLRLKTLNLTDTPIKDLAGLDGLPLKYLYLAQTRVNDLAPLKNVKLTRLNLSGSPVKDLAPLAGMELKWLRVDHTAVVSLDGLKGVPIEALFADETSIDDLTPLTGAPLRELSIEKCPVSDLSPLKGAPLETLNIRGTRVTDLSDVADAPLRSITLDLAPTHLAVLKSIPTLELINGQKADTFLDDVAGK